MKEQTKKSYLSLASNFLKTLLIDKGINPTEKNIRQALLACAPDYRPNYWRRLVVQQLEAGFNKTAKAIEKVANPITAVDASDAVKALKKPKQQRRKHVEKEEHILLKRHLTHKGDKCLLAMIEIARIVGCRPIEMMTLQLQPNHQILITGAKKTGEANYSHNLQKLEWFQPYLGGKQLVDISQRLIEEIIGLKYEETSGGTANRYIAVISAVLRSAVKWEWLIKTPYIQRFQEKKKRVRWLRPADYLHLLTFLPDYLTPMVQFSVATGLRQSNVKLLKWDQIDLARKAAWIHPEDAKADEAISVPLNDDAIQALTSLIGQDQTYVFTRNGKPVMDPNNRDWREALTKAEIENFRWHDLRHTWASWHVQNGTPLYVLKELGGWKTLAMDGREVCSSCTRTFGAIRRKRISGKWFSRYKYGTGGLNKKGAYLRKRPNLLVPRAGIEPARPQSRGILSTGN